MHTGHRYRGWVLVWAAWVSWGTLAAQSGPERREVLTRRAFLQRFERLTDDQDAAVPVASMAGRSEVRDLVAHAPWHAASAALVWLDRALSSKTTEASTLDLRRAAVVGRILADTRDAPGIRDMVARVRGWSGEDRVRYLEAQRLEDQGQAAEKAENAAEARRCFAEARRRHREVGREDRATRCAVRIGNGHYRQSEFQAALEAWQQALAGWERLGHVRGAATALTNLGLAHEKLGALKRAMACHERGLKLHREMSDGASAARSMTELAGLLWRLDRRMEALLRFRQAVVYARKHADEPAVAGVLETIGDVFARVNQYRFSVHHYRQALEIRRRCGGTADEDRVLFGLLRSLQRLGHYEESVRLAAEALERCEKAGDRDRIASMLAIRGVSLDQLGRLDEAAADHERALAIRREDGKPLKELARCYDNLAVVREHQGRYREAVALHRKGLELRESIGDPWSLAWSLNNYGCALKFLGRYHEALRMHQRALRLREKLGDPYDISWSLLNLGDLYQTKGQSREARVAFERCLAIREKIGNPLLLAWVLIRLGVPCAIVGEGEKGIEYVERGLALGRRLGRRAVVADGLMDLGIVHRLLDRHEQALTHLEACLAVREEIGPRSRLNSVLLLVADTLASLHRPDQARACLERVLASAQATGDAEEIAGALAAFGDLHADLGQTDRAIARYERALDRAGQGDHPQLTADLRNRLGRVLDSRGQHERARALYRRNVDAPESADLEREQTRALEYLGLSCLQTAELDRAREALTRAHARHEAQGRRMRAGVCLAQLGNVEAAAGRFSRAFELQARASSVMREAGRVSEAARILVHLGHSQLALGRIEQAKDHLVRARELVKGKNAIEVETQIHMILAFVFWLQGQKTRALTEANRAEALFRSRNPALNTLEHVYGFAMVFGLLGQFERGHAYLDRLETLAASSHRKLALAPVTFHRLLPPGGFHGEAASRFFTHVVRVIEKVGDPRALAVCLVNAGAASAKNGRIRQALAHYERSIALLEKRSEPDASLAATLATAGGLHYYLGHLDNAVRLLQRARDLAARAGRPADRVAVLNNLAACYHGMGLERQARDTSREALRAARESGDASAVASVLVNLGAMEQSLGRYEEAIQAMEQARIGFEETGDGLGAASVLVNQGVLDLHRDRFASARRKLEEARARLAAYGDPPEDTAVCLNMLGTALCRSGQAEAALSYHEQALALRESTGHGLGQAACWNNLFEANRVLGRMVEARKCLTRAVQCLTRVRLALAGDRERVALLSRWQGDLLLDAVETALASRPPEFESDPDLAWRILESLRGMATADLLQSSMRGVRGHGESGLLNALRATERKIDEVEVRIRDAVRSGTTRAAPEIAEATKPLREKQRTLEERWQELLSQLARTDPELAGFRRPEPIRLQTLQRRLPAKTAFVTFVLGSRASLLIVVDQYGLRTWPLADLGCVEQAVQAHLAQLERRPDRKPVEPGDDTEVLTTGRRLHELLLAPAAAALRDHDTLIVAPSGVLNGVPLETLVEPGGPRDLRAAPYLLHRHSILYVHSATVWDIHRRRAHRRHAEYAAGIAARPAGLMVLADPISQAEAGAPAHPTVEAVFDLERRGGWGRIPFTRLEALQVFETFQVQTGLDPAQWRLTVDGRAIPDRASRERTLAQFRSIAPEVRSLCLRLGPSLEVRLGRAASRQALLADTSRLEDLRFLHLAVHADVHPENPGLTGLWLSPSATDSGCLRLPDLMDMRLRAELVTLSGCETQLGKLTAGEGYQGLVRAFLYAGADSVIASCWKVSDRRTAALLPDVYQGILRHGLDPLQALRVAKQRYLHRVSPDRPASAHPGYWGAWMLWGTGRPVDPGR